MPIATAPTILGTHAFFFLDGKSATKDVSNATVAAFPASRTAKPGSTDIGWVGLGVIEEASDSPVASEKIEIFAPTPGVLRKYDVLETKRQSKGSFKCKELSALAIQVLYRTLALTASSTQYNRLEGQIVKGWLKIQRYNQADTIAIAEDLYAMLEIKGDVQMGGGGLVEVEFEYDVLHSTLNTSTL